MRIAQVAPLSESVPPQGYGGTERIVSYLTEELVRRGHEVTLFASADSDTQAKLMAACPQALRTMEGCRLPEVYQVLMIEQVFQAAAQFDLIHFHIDMLHFPLARRCHTPHVTTLHGRLDLPELGALFEAYDELPMVSISNSQRKPLAGPNWQGTVYHGLPQDLFTFHEQPGDYLAFIGRISPEKRLDRAINIAQRAGMKLKVAAKIDKVDRAYYETEIEPLMQPPHVEFIGEVSGHEKEAFLGEAYALLFPIDWPEPFGLVMIESFACGTPVVAYRCGSVPEVMQEGVSGFVVDSIEEAVGAVEKVAELSRQRCRAYFEDRFSDTRMADDYLSVYRALRTSWNPPSGASPAGNVGQAGDHMRSPRTRRTQRATGS